MVRPIHENPITLTTNETLAHAPMIVREFSRIPSLTDLVDIALSRRQMLAEFTAKIVPIPRLTLQSFVLSVAVMLVGFTAIMADSLLSIRGNSRNA